MTFESLYREQWAVMVRMAWMMTGSRELAEDLVHDGFFKLEAVWDSVEAPAPYLRKVIVNLVGAQRRRQAVESGIVRRRRGVDGCRSRRDLGLSCPDTRTPT